MNKIFLTLEVFGLGRLFTDFAMAFDFGLTSSISLSSLGFR